MDTISLDLYGLQHAIAIMPHSRAREDTAQPSRLPAFQMRVCHDDLLKCKAG
ncbi:hypothetical protein BSU04_43540 [Caballeronia sordidicola]|uniref:Uncharacterized protein n=1 Tax=Caballeronia sordidicola TaxID=196367 RepID=A0A226WLR3_CABSO|nr:hypothetical protein BSU04_43540 [Caballeronia sordidicola]